MEVGNCGTESDPMPLLAIFVNKLYNLNVSAFSICLRDFLSLLLIKGSTVQKEALGRLDAETAVLSFLVGTQGNYL
jgi:hypothetical protein